MTPEQFFDLFLEELRQNENLHRYYKFLGDPGKLAFRKAYFIQRLQYVLDQMPEGAQSNWDCGCGYGTTNLFLAMNGIPTLGTTLEFYFDQIPPRLDYWQQHGDVSLFEYRYENVLDSRFEPETFDTILVQDTLHHLEPIGQCLRILFDALKRGGRMIVVEENGNNLIQNAKLYWQRGNRRVIERTDEKTGKTFLLGNENIRGLDTWRRLLGQAGFEVSPHSVKFIRVLPPFLEKDARHLIERESRIHAPWLKKYFFFGLNYVAEKPSALQP